MDPDVSTRIMTGNRRSIFPSSTFLTLNGVISLLPNRFPNTSAMLFHLVSYFLKIIFMCSYARIHAHPCPSIRRTRRHSHYHRMIARLLEATPRGTATPSSVTLQQFFNAPPLDLDGVRRFVLSITFWPEFSVFWVSSDHLGQIVLVPYHHLQPSAGVPSACRGTARYASGEISANGRNILL